MRKLLLTVAVVGIGGFFGAKFFVEHKAAQDLDALLDQVRPMVDIEYRQLVATIDGELRAEHVTIRMPKFNDELRIDSVGVLTPGFLFLLGFNRNKLEFPEYLGVELTGLRASADADFMRTLDDVYDQQVAAIELTPADRCAGTYGMTPAALKRLGYHEVVMDARVSFRTDADRLVMDFGADIEDMYDLDVEVTLDGVADPTTMVRGARPMLVGARMDYIDRSLNERIVKHCADQQVTREDVIAAQLREVQAMALERGVELDAPLIEPYTDFLQGKQRFTLISAPPRPVDLTRVSLYRPSDVPNLLHLTAETG